MYRTWRGDRKISSDGFHRLLYLPMVHVRRHLPIHIAFPSRGLHSGMPLVMRHEHNYPSFLWLNRGDRLTPIV